VTTTLAIEGGSPVREDYLVFGQPVLLQEEIDEVVDSLRNRWIGTGPKVARFEDQFRLYVGAGQAKAVNSCTAALHLSMLASGVGPGDEVVTTSLTFAATVNAILHTGATPVLVDVERQSQNLDPELVRAAISGRTKAIMPVHMAGRPCDLAGLGQLAQQHGLLVIEDAAHAIGAEYRGQKIGSISDLTAFSFYATKNITTGEGGMVTTENEEWAERIETLALHGLSRGAWRRFSDEGYRHYGVVAPGFKYNMMDLQAAIGIHQLARVEQWRSQREKVWNRYDDAFAELPLVTPGPPEAGTVHARHLYTVMVDIDELACSRDWMQEALHREGIGTGIHFLAIHEHPYFEAALPYQRGDFPNAEWISQRTLSLPLSAGLTDDDVESVVEAVHKVVGAARAGRGH
jgi:dTDP-4-amino-4,6-dideoxygalactose transaminase